MSAWKRREVIGNATLYLLDSELDAIGASVPAGIGYTARRDRAIADAAAKKARLATLEESASYATYAEYKFPYSSDVQTDHQRGYEQGRNDAATLILAMMKIGLSDEK